MPRKKTAPRPGVCQFCGDPFESARVKRFCTEAHRRAFASLNEKRGAIIMPYLMAWTMGKGGGNTKPHPVAGWSMKELTGIVRGFIDEDREAGRPPSTDYAESLRASGFLYCDRKNPNRGRARTKSKPMAEIESHNARWDALCLVK